MKKKKKYNSHLQGNSAESKFQRWKLKHKYDKPTDIEDEKFKKWKKKFHLE